MHCFLPEAYLVGGVAVWLSGCRPRLMSRRSLNDYQAKRPLATRIERWLHRRMDLVLGTSNVVARQLAEEGMPVERIGLIYNGVGIPAVSKSRAQMRKELRIPQESGFILVANLIPYRSHADLIEAMALAAPRLPPKLHGCLRG